MSLYARTSACLPDLMKVYNARTTVESIDPQRLKDEGIAAIIFDHDGVLGPNKGVAPDETGKAILRSFVTLFGVGNIFVLSNTRSVAEERKEYYATHLRDVIWLTAIRKPSGDGFRQVVERVGVKSNTIAVIDDGLLTGILMAVENNGHPIYAKRAELTETLWPKIIRLCTTGAQLLIYRLAALLQT